MRLCCEEQVGQNNTSLSPVTADEVMVDCEKHSNVPKTLLKSTGVQVNSLDAMSTDNLVASFNTINDKLDNFQSINVSNNFKKIDNCKNLYDILEIEPVFKLNSVGNDTQIFCDKCKKYGEKKNIVQRGGGQCGTLTVGYKIDLEKLRSGANQQWYNFKHQIKTHLNSTIHSNAVAMDNESKLRLCRNKISCMNQFRVATTVLKLKAYASQYETLNATLNKSGAEFGVLSCTRNRFNEILLSLIKK